MAWCVCADSAARVLDVATHIATQLITQTLTTRQNPVSISAASIYITCLLEGTSRHSPRALIRHRHQAHPVGHLQGSGPHRGNSPQVLPGGRRARQGFASAHLRACGAHRPRPRSLVPGACELCTVCRHATTGSLRATAQRTAVSAHLSAPPSTTSASAAPVTACQPAAAAATTPRCLADATAFADFAHGAATQRLDCVLIGSLVPPAELSTAVLRAHTATAPETASGLGVDRIFYTLATPLGHLAGMQLA